MPLQAWLILGINFAIIMYSSAHPHCSIPLWPSAISVSKAKMIHLTGPHNACSVVFCNMSWGQARL